MSFTESIEIREEGIDFVICDTAGDFFYKADDTIRKFKSPSAAVAWLKTVCQKYNCGYVITMPDKSEKRIGLSVLKEKGFLPHVWHKVNGATIIRGNSTYDIYQCDYCRKEEKAYGLSGHRLETGICLKRPKSQE